MTERIEVIQGDITRQAVDAIVNAANTRKMPCWPDATELFFACGSA